MVTTWNAPGPHSGQPYPGQPYPGRAESGRRTLSPSSGLVVVVGTLLAWEGWQTLAGSSGGVGRAVTLEGMTLVGPAILVLVVAALVAERLWPAVHRPLLSRGHRQDAAYLALYVVVAVPAVTLLGTGFATILFRAAPWLVLHQLPAAPRWALIAFVLVVMDGCNWAAHFLNHRIGSFWRFHALHHSQEEMSILTSFRAHPLVHASFQIAALPLLVLGTSGIVPVPVLIAYVMLSTLPHANVPWSFGPLGYVVVSPAYHRLHHDVEDTRGVNLATVLVIWDVLFGLAVFPSRGGAPVATGLRGRPVPVEQASDAPGCVGTIGRQLVEPLWHQRSDPAAQAAWSESSWSESAWSKSAWSGATTASIGPSPVLIGVQGD